MRKLRKLPAHLGPLTIDIPRIWTPEQALALFELIDDLRDKVWSLYADQIQGLLREQHVCGAPGKNCGSLLRCPRVVHI
jgi:hypothetical protein